MKKMLAWMLAAALLLGMAMPALAEEELTVQYATTQSFVDVLVEQELKYTLEGIDENGYEKIRLKLRDNQGNRYDIEFYFGQEQDSCNLRVFGMITYAEEDLTDVLRAVNDLNRKWKFVKFYINENSRTVAAAVDLLFNDADVGSIVMEGTLKVNRILKDGFTVLNAYDQ